MALMQSQHPIGFASRALADAESSDRRGVTGCAFWNEIIPSVHVWERGGCADLSDAIRKHHESAAECTQVTIMNVSETPELSDVTIRF